MRDGSGESKEHARENVHSEKTRTKTRDFRTRDLEQDKIIEHHQIDFIIIRINLIKLSIQENTLEFKLIIVLHDLFLSMKIN